MENIAQIFGELILDYDEKKLVTKYKGHQFLYFGNMIKYKNLDIYLNNIDYDLAIKCQKSICDFLIFILDCYYRSVNSIDDSDFHQYMKKISLINDMRLHINMMDGYHCTNYYKQYFVKYKPICQI